MKGIEDENGNWAHKLIHYILSGAVPVEKHWDGTQLLDKKTSVSELFCYLLSHLTTCTCFEALTHRSRGGSTVHNCKDTEVKENWLCCCSEVEQWCHSLPFGSSKLLMAVSEISHSLVHYIVNCPFSILSECLVDFLKPCIVHLLNPTVQREKQWTTNGH